MMLTSGGGAAYEGRNDHLRIVVINGASDPVAAAQADTSGAGIAGFVLVHGPQPFTVSGRASSLIEYRQDGGTNPVTGRPLVLHVVRLYVPRPGGLYRIEYAATTAAGAWDPQGARDIVITFRPGPS